MADREEKCHDLTLPPGLDPPAGDPTGSSSDGDTDFNDGETGPRYIPGQRRRRAFPVESGVGLMTHQLHVGSELLWLIRTKVVVACRQIASDTARPLLFSLREPRPRSTTRKFSCTTSSLSEIN